MKVKQLKDILNLYHPNQEVLVIFSWDKGEYAEYYIKGLDIKDDVVGIHVQ